MVTPNFWPFLNHLLTEESEVDKHNATPVANRLLPLFQTLAEKTPSGFEKKVFNYLTDYVSTYAVAPSRMAFFTAISASSHAADSSDIQEFSARIQTGALLRYAISDSQMLLDQYEQGRDIWILQNTIQTALEINQAPIKINGKELFGYQAAIDYTQRVVATLGSSSNEVNRIDLNEDGEEAYSKYLGEKEDASSCLKLRVGLKDLDDHFKGFRKGELITLMGYTGDGKTTVCINWAYQAFLQGLNVVYITLELPADDIRSRFHVRHSANFALWGQEAIHLSKYMDYELSEEEANHMFRRVVPDFQKNSDPSFGLRGSIRILEPKEGGFSFSVLKAELLRLHSEYPVDVFYLDYPNLMDVAPDRGQDFDKAMSRLYVKLKTMCRTFNDGDRLIGFIPTQINRSGREAAEKNNGIYNLRAIQEYSEIANSSDFVFGCFRDAALAGSNECLFSNPKARRAGPVQPFRASFIGSTCHVDDVEAGALPPEALPNNIMPSFDL